MIKIENTEVVGWKQAIRGMRNYLNESLEESDSEWCGTNGRMKCCDCLYMSDTGWGCTFPGTGAIFCVGKNDYDLIRRLIREDPAYSKFRQMIVVYADITAPLYWQLIEFDAYEVVTMENSLSSRKRTVMMNYEVLSNIYHSRIDHKSDEWQDFCRWIENLPFSTIITTCRKEG